MFLSLGANGIWMITGHNCEASTKPVSTGSLVREQIERLVPRPSIGVAPPGGTTLVNIQTVLWVDTASTRSLGVVTLIGKRVALQVSVASVHWSFGDGSGETVATPGPPYSGANPCSTPMCPGYFGHVYRSTGQLTVTATVTWTGRYRIGTGAWQQITGTVTGPPAALTITVHQARGVLVGS